MVRGVLLDVDGVLVVSWEPLPGARECLHWLGAHGLDVCLVTNTSSKTRRQIAQVLTGAGMEVGPAQIETAVSAAARYLRERHPGVKCLVVNDGPVGEDLVGVPEASAANEAGVVLLGGAGPQVGYADLNAAFALALEGVPIVALHRNTRFQTAEGPALDMGAFVVGLEAAAGIEIPVLGKPAPEFFRAALAEIGVDAPDAVMVGDDIQADVRGAQAVGMTGVLVKTGKFRPRDLDDGGAAPDHVIDHIGNLPALLRRLEAAEES